MIDPKNWIIVDGVKYAPVDEVLSQYERLLDKYAVVIDKYCAKIEESIGAGKPE